MSLKTRVLLLICSVILIPVGTWLLLPGLPSLGQVPEIFSGGTSYPASEIPFQRVNIGPDPVGLPLITNVQIVDFDGDGTNEILGCDSGRGIVSLFTKQGAETWQEKVVLSDLAAPGHATVVDIDGDGDQDLIVSILGNLLPDDRVIGRVELYERQGDEFIRHVILDDVRRVADVQPGDFDGDGDLDLAVAVFGYSRGSVLWLENRGDLKFRDHELLNAPGTIHVPVADYDGDGDLDIAAIVTQDEEELWGFENLGQGKFKKRRLWMTVNLDLGGAGLIHADLDQDGDQDLILPAGDNLEDLDAYPQPYHGCLWFENKGNWEFEMRRISNLGGTYAADVGDLDGDGDLDVVLVSMTNDWYDPKTASVVWLENDGKQNFQTWQIDNNPIHLVTVAVGDLTGEGRDDIVAGGLNLRKPYQRIGRISAWLNQGGATP
ncbi:VCBS repeat-containing protein [uncultured Gimesia sp.]|uniref:FG-GAP repeat domain-containing protein n=1 Tax=uncultured Gimesia sp. TaxID=1678688 RepID=UPI0030D8FD81|tara:strand:+ start:222700 stop:224001 length:1302 start_codon:yes stop_codon:yes gene_type:complete